MDMQPITCDRPAIERLLADRLGDSELTILEAHLDGCSDCRQYLDNLAADGRLWQEARGFLSDGDVTSDPDTAITDHGIGKLAGLRAYLTPTDDTRFLGRLGGYGVVALIGCGGFGVVLKAFDAALNRYVAIKALSPQLALSGAARQRFAREARAAAAVVHDHVVAIHSVADADGLPYFVMPYVSGPSLEKRLRQAGPLAVVEVLRIGMQVASGLAAAHAQGLVHRDIKPANILLEDGTERVTITDFGLARAVDDASLTRSGVIAGTPPYMSPEQAAGLAVDHRSDLFSLGSLLYAMCTGRPPFRADSTLAVLRRVEECRPRPIREINPEIPDWLAGIVGKLHAKDPANRFQSAAEVAAILERCVAHVQEPIGHALPPGVAALARPIGRRRWLLAAVASAAIAAALFAMSFRPAGNDSVGQKKIAERKSPIDPADRFDDEFLAQVGNTRAELQRLKWSLADEPPKGDLLGPAMAGMRHRTEALRQTLDSESDPASDRFAVDFANVSKRLAALGVQIGPGAN
jgi:eukaryotic-like serine/threonine-protein kinase